MPQKSIEADSDEFECDSLDDADLLAAAAEVESSRGRLKRKDHPLDDYPAMKKVASSDSKHAVEYMSKCAIATETLRAVFCLENFKLKQEVVISRLVQGGSAVVVFPTGGGKSLCYQVPALVFAEQDKLDGSRGEADGGITLVVSPLIALMKDQVDALLRRGVKAAVMDSTKTREEYLATTDSIRAGTLKLLYVAPERLNNEGFIEQMKTLRGGIRMVAVDEAHCISEWGHAFRPDYLKVSRFVEEVQAERVVCLTATATPRVAQDICAAFRIGLDGLFRTSSYRSNLQLLATSAATKMQLYPQLFQFLRENPGPTIIYVTLQKQTELLAKDLQDQGFTAIAFHAGMQSAVKMKVQDNFMTSEDLIIVATIAFGMGVDKANIRNVIHFNIPSSLESYSQEIGRAGRDGNPSKCMFYVCGEDVHLREIFARGDLPSRESVSKLLHEIFDLENATSRVGQTLEVSQFNQSKQYDIRILLSRYLSVTLMQTNTLNNIYAQLEMRFGLIRAITPIYSKYSYTTDNLYFAKAEIDKSVAALAIRSHAQKAKTLYHLDVSTASAASGIPRADIIRKLNEWNDSQVIELKTAGVINVYRILKQLPHSQADIKVIVDALYADMESREQRDLKRTDEVLDLVTGRACFSKTLASHFGDELHGGVSECGHCSWCATHRPVPLILPPPIDFNSHLFSQVLAAVPARDDARFLARVAFGISSPRSTAMKLTHGGPVFGCMGDHSFMELLRRFTSVCSGIAQGTISQPSLLSGTQRRGGSYTGRGGSDASTVSRGNPTRGRFAGTRGGRC